MKTKFFLLAGLLILMTAATHIHPSSGAAEHKSFNKPEEVRTFSLGKLELVTLHGAKLGRATFQPGWKWSTSLKESSGTKSCAAPHYQYHVSGTLRILMDDGTTFDCKAGDVSALPMGHDAWVIGKEPVVVIDFQGMVDYAKAK
ncbi:MAG: cupin domain-containing protein [Saprospiraceae bacterium]|nr:cupin domain-containing protein [Saprospiraceae bacterium]